MAIKESVIYICDRSGKETSNKEDMDTKFKFLKLIYEDGEFETTIDIEWKDLDKRNSKSVRECIRRLVKIREAPVLTNMGEQNGQE